MDLIDRSKLHSVSVVDGINSEGVITTRSFWASDVANAPTVEAIPIEWIKQWDIKCQDGKLDHWLYDNYEWHDAIMAMLEDWGEENEIS